MEYKQVILVRTDLDMSKGKIAAQVAHASLDSALKSIKKDRIIFNKWKSNYMKKVVLRVDTKEELFKYKELSNNEGIVCSLIRDAGRTEIKEGSYTALSVGPDTSEKIDKITGNLKML